MLVAFILASCSLIALFSAPSIVGDARAQTWVKIPAGGFPAGDGYVSSIWATSPQIVVIGWHWNVTTNQIGMVMRTTDGGAHWNNCILGLGLGTNNTPQVTDIWFLTPDTGWMTLGGSSGSLDPGDPWLWRTVDSGKTWNPTWTTSKGLTAPVNFGAAFGLAAVWQTDSTLVITQNLGGHAWYSKDTGANWYSSSLAHVNGVAFDDLDGVASEFGENQTTTFLTTTDGGQTWQNSLRGFQHEGWNVHHVQRSSGVFLAAPEDTTFLGVSRGSPVYRSTNYGLQWTNIFPDSLPINTTGDMEGIEGVLYVQSNGGMTNADPKNNLMESNDGGYTWIGVGGPSQGGPGDREPDTRFAVTGCGNIVYASDFYAGLWKTVDGPGLMVIDLDTMRPISAIICDTTRQLYYLHNLNSSQIVLESIQILDSNRRPATTHAVWLDSIPDPYSIIPTDDSIAFKLAWHPGAMMDSAATDSATIRVIFYASYLAPCVSEPQLAYDTVLLRVKLQGLSVLPEYATSANTIKNDTLLMCMSLDTTIDLINMGCDLLAITNTTFAKNAWSVSDLAGNKLKLPIRLGSGDTLHLELHATPTSKAVLYDSLEVKMHYMGQDTVWGMALRTYVKFDTAHPALTTRPALAFDSLATCDSTDELLTLSNTGCDTLSISKFDLANVHFELLDTNGKPLPLPVKIPTDSSRQVMVRFIPGTLGGQNATLRLHYLRSLYAAFDSSNVVTLTGTGAASGTLAYPKSHDFGSVSICQPGYADTTITFKNTSCNSDWIDSLALSGSFLLGNPIKIPEWLAAGGNLKLDVRYQPSAKTLETGAVYLHVWINSGKTPIYDTIQLSGTGTAGPSTFETNPALTATTFAFDTLSECDPATSVTFTVYNTECDTLRVTGLTLDPGLIGTFAAQTDKPLPALLVKGDSLHVTLAITALVTNTYSGNFYIQYTLADGSVHDSAMPVTLDVTTASGASALTLSSPTSFDFKTVRSCAEPTPDTTIAITNTGCGTDTVIVSITGTGFTLGKGQDTLFITPGGTKNDTIYYDDTSHGNLSATVTLQTDVKNNNFTSVQLSGIAPPVDTVHFNIAFSKMPVASGQGFTASLVPDIPVSGKGLKTIHGVFEYRSNNFEVIPNSMTSNFALTQNGPTQVGSIERYSFDVTNPNDIPLDPSTPVVTLPMIAMVSDSVGGMIAVDSLSLNPSDPTFSTCQLASNTFASDASLAIRCGDSTLIYYMRGKPLVTAERLRPNPVTSENGYQTTLDLTAAEDGTALIALYDGLGREVAHDVITLTHGVLQPYTFHLQNLPAGSYYYQLRFTGISASGSTKGMLLLEK